MKYRSYYGNQLFTCQYPEEIKLSIGSRLKEEREKLKMNQTDFGAIGNVTKQAQINYESGRRVPSADYLAAIAALGVDIQYIVTGIRSLNVAEVQQILQHQLEGLS